MSSYRLKRLGHGVKFALVAICLTVFGVGIDGFGATGFSTVAQAAVVNDISVRGNQRMEDETVISYLTIQPGVRFGASDIDQSLTELFSTGLFRDASIYQSGSVLIVEVDENPVVNRVFFEGNKRIKDENLASVVRTQPRGIYSEGRVVADEELILEAHRRVGRDDANVSSRIVELSNNRVNVVFEVSEGDKTRISQITFVGNKAFGDFRLRDIIRHSKTNLFSWLTNDDIFDQDKLRADEELLRQFYYNNGYADFDVISAVADHDPDANRYYITITVDEGERYEFGDIYIDSTIPGIDTQSLYSVLKTNTGRTYSALLVERSLVNLSNEVAALGFAFSEVTPRGDRDFENRTISITYLIDQGRRVYIERIEIVGNTRTRDYVIRREFDLSEGDALNQALVKSTKTRLDALGFFESVRVSTRPGSSSDRVVLVVDVEDKPTGEISITGGYNSASGPVAQISFSEKNFLGRGQFLKVAGGLGEDVTNYSLAFTEPYFLGRRLTAGFRIDITESTETSNRNYVTNSSVGELFLAAPLTEHVIGKVFYRYDQQDLSIGTRFKDAGTDNITPTHVSEALQQAEGDWVKSGLGYQLVFNTLDNTKSPREGLHVKFGQVFYGVGGDANYFSSEISASYYNLISAQFDLVAMVRGRAGHIANFGGTYRINDNFYKGGNSVRGFDSYGFGPRDPVTGDALGGRTFFDATVELQFPMPLLPDSFGMRAAIFADAGSLFNLDGTSKARALAGVSAVTDVSSLTDESIRASVGVGIIWDSPFGPLRADYAFPVQEQPWDDQQQFRFGVNSTF